MPSHYISSHNDYLQRGFYRSLAYLLVLKKLSQLHCTYVDSTYITPLNFGPPIFWSKPNDRMFHWSPLIFVHPRTKIKGGGNDVSTNHLHA